MKRFLPGLIFLFALIFSPWLASPAAAQGQPCQWNYVNINGVATAIYCGNVVSQGSINIPSVNTVSSVAALASITTAPNGVVYTALGYYAASDLGGGQFLLNTSSAATIDGCTVFAAPTGRWLRMNVGSNLTIAQCGGKNDGTLPGAGTITSGTTALSVPGASFTSADVGKLIVVNKAGAPGASSSPLVTTIAAVVDATHVTTAAPAGATTPASGNDVVYGTDNTAFIDNAIGYLKTQSTCGTLSFGGGAFVDQGGHDFRNNGAPGTCILTGNGQLYQTRLYHVGNNIEFRVGNGASAVALFDGGVVQNFEVEAMLSPWGAASGVPSNAVFVQLENAFGIQIKNITDYNYFYGVADFVLNNTAASTFTEGAMFEDVVSNNSRVQLYFTAQIGANGSYNEFHATRLYQNMGVANIVAYPLNGFTICNQILMAHDGVEKQLYNAVLDRAFWPPPHSSYRSVEILSPNVNGGLNRFQATIDNVSSDGPNTANDATQPIYYYHNDNGVNQGLGTISIGRTNQNQSQGLGYYQLDATSGAPVNIPTMNAIFNSNDSLAATSFGFPAMDVHHLYFPVRARVKANAASFAFDTGLLPPNSHVGIMVAGTFNGANFSATYDAATAGASNTPNLGLTSGSVPAGITVAAVAGSPAIRTTINNAANASEADVIVKYNIE